MNLEIIKKLAKEYDQKAQALIEAERKEYTPRFVQLVDKFGVSAVSAATGLAESTVIQYLRCKVVPVSKDAIEKAECILLSL